LSFFDAILLGLIQGLTEFLPISSSGHLVLGQALLEVKQQDILFEVFVHFGTLLAVFVLLWRDIIDLFKSFFGVFKRKQSLSEYYKTSADFRTVVFILIATLPAVIIGLLLNSHIQKAFADPIMACYMLIVTALILSASYFTPTTLKPNTVLISIAMGLAQALAIFPGISRSGSTISTGMILGIGGHEAARFSFLLSIPAILGATILEGMSLFTRTPSSQTIYLLITGAAVSFIAGYVSMKVLLRVVKKGKLYWFAPYCLILGVLGLLFL
jgi:undecaprenyl-diphosphatase